MKYFMVSYKILILLPVAVVQVIWLVVFTILLKEASGSLNWRYINLTHLKLKHIFEGERALTDLCYQDV